MSLCLMFFGCHFILFDTYCLDYQKGYIKRLRKCYDKFIRELNEVLKNALSAVGVAAVITIATVAVAGALAPAIAVALVGSNFAGLGGAALTSACLAYLGGGAIAAGGAGMAGGLVAIVGGGAVWGWVPGRLWAARLVRLVWPAKKIPLCNRLSCWWQFGRYSSMTSMILTIPTVFMNNMYGILPRQKKAWWNCA